ncbi:MAG: hypothetical protein LKJ83_10585 [Eubacteriaceae bacterium]|jgi:hypothetical protein|nr:hypothetical protein [Eubacteriaceae bacterium]
MTAKTKLIGIILIIVTAVLVAFSVFWTETAPHDPGSGYKASAEAEHIYKYRNDTDKLGSYVTRIAKKEGLQVRVIRGSFTDSKTALTFKITNEDNTTNKQNIFVAEYSAALMAAARPELTAVHWVLKDGETILLPDADYLKDVEGKLSKYGASPEGIQQVMDTVKEKETAA